MIIRLWFIICASMSEHASSKINRKWSLKQTHPQVMLEMTTNVLVKKNTHPHGYVKYVVQGIKNSMNHNLHLIASFSLYHYKLTAHYQQLIHLKIFYCIEEDTISGRPESETKPLVYASFYTYLRTNLYLLPSLL